MEDQVRNAAEVKIKDSSLEGDLETQRNKGQRHPQQHIQSQQVSKQ